MIQPFRVRHRRLQIPYYKQVLRYAPIAYWPLWEPTGSQATDISGNERHGSYTGVTLAQIGIGDGYTCPLFDGANDYANIYSTSLRDAFDGAEGAVMIWAKVYNLGVWTDAEQRHPYYISADANNRIQLPRRTVTDNTLQSIYEAGGTAESQIGTTHGGTITWMHLALTWSATADQVIYYVNGAQWGATDTTLGTWAGNIINTSTVIGARNITPTKTWYGWLAHAAIFDTPLTAAQIAILARVI